ncbi:altronate dehydratase family protein [Salinimicrobium sp. MT39]|uniref:Altronate dehydratase family protein n=1 Tax=Salinimicrobium profundisediminis TaxID=2994553 RepID=A0A9X3CWS0_9FLAO|nr:altronate dehydratase family protein [Salinimicrobium profundisediminis]MCX2838241.1 altronate dehydratase family protein [Salinimicrobium profundisediminis]
MKTKIIKVHPEDNVAVALADLWQGEVLSIDDIEVEVFNDVAAKHKISLVDLDEGDKIFMYGVLVGKATVPIKKGGVLTVDNVKHQAEQAHKKTETTGWTVPDISKWKNRTFNGYHRPDGQVGTKNVWLFFPLVFCENRNIELLKEVFEKELSFRKPSREQLLLRKLIQGENTTESLQIEEEESEIFDNIEVKFITHQGGCGGIRQDSASLARLLAGYVNNPNVAGATVLSLGCQNLQIDIFKKALERINFDNRKPVLLFEQQQMGTLDEMMSKIISDSYAAIKEANNITRKPAPLSKLKLGLECGGSDGFSGISANPALGYASDLLSALGGSPILSEFPELCGIEQELINRCVSDDLAERFLELTRAFEQSAIDAGSGFDMNPSPGNIKDGLITDAMKSAGAAKKGGTSPIQDVLDYGDYVTKPGLNLLCTPGNDVESTTAMVGAGANVVVFTTGLGTPTGNPVAPVVKVSSNSTLARRMPDIIDLDAGGVIKAEKTIEQMGEEILEFIIKVANGEETTKADALNQDDFIPWKRGVSL